MKKVIGLVIAPIVAFLLSYLYVLGLDFSREWAFWGIVNTTVVAPFIFAGIIGACAASFLGKNVPMAIFSGLICGIAGEYGNWVFSVRSAFDVWIWNPEELIQAARMFADMHEIGVLFIDWTGSGLAFMYWIEASILVLGAILGACVIADEDDSKKTKEKQNASTGTGKVATVMIVIGMGLLMTGCSSEEHSNKLPDKQAVSAWVSKQNWKQYETGSTFRKENLNGETCIGIGIAAVPEGGKLKKANRIRTKVLAARAIFNEAEIEDPSKVAVVFDREVNVKGEVRQVTVLATRVSGNGITNVKSVDSGFLSGWAEKQDWAKYNDGGTVVTEGDCVIGIGIAEVAASGDEKMKSKMEAMKAIAKKNDGKKLGGVITVFTGMKEIRGAKKFVTVLAVKK